MHTHIHLKFSSLGRNLVYYFTFWYSDPWRTWEAHQFDGGSNYNWTVAFAVERLGSQHTPKQTEAT